MVRLSRRCGSSSARVAPCSGAARSGVALVHSCAHFVALPGRGQYARVQRAKCVLEAHICSHSATPQCVRRVSLRSTANVGCPVAAAPEATCVKELAQGAGAASAARPAPVCSALRHTPLTGVLWAVGEATKRGFYGSNPAWCNLGQGQPEVGRLDGGPERVRAVDIYEEDNACVGCGLRACTWRRLRRSALTLAWGRAGLPQVRPCWRLVRSATRDCFPLQPLVPHRGNEEVHGQQRVCSGRRPWRPCPSVRDIAGARPLPDGQATVAYAHAGASHLMLSPTRRFCQGRVGYTTPEYSGFNVWNRRSVYAHIRPPLTNRWVRAQDGFTRTRGTVEAVHLKTTIETEFCLQPAALRAAAKGSAARPKVDAVLMSNPCNPTGGVLKGKKLEAYVGWYGCQHLCDVHAHSTYSARL